MSPYELFDGVICLCLDKRKEHWRELQKQFEALGVEFIAYVCGDGSDAELIYDQIDLINPDVSQFGYGHNHLKHHHLNAFRGHLGMAQRVKEKGWKRTLFVEDDLDLPVVRFELLMNGIELQKDELEYALSFPVFYLSWWMGDEYDSYNNSLENAWEHNGRMAIVEVTPGTNLGGLHMVIFREDMYDILLSLKPILPIDSQLCHLRSQIPAILLEPKAGTVKSIHSYTENCTFNRRKLY